MKMKKMLLTSALTTLFLVGCSELTETEVNENGKEVEVKYQKMASINYEDVKVVKSTNYSTDSGEYSYSDSEGIDYETNQMFAEYKHKETDAEKVQNFLLTYRLGTLTDVKKAPSEGYVIVLGYDEREYHIAKNVSTYYGETEATLINGIEITTNDYYKKIEYQTKEQLERIIKDAEEKVTKLKVEFGMEEEQVEAAKTE